jgi:predicted acylesterase/phospholipase RssA
MVSQCVTPLLHRVLKQNMFVFVSALMLVVATEAFLPLIVSNPRSSRLQQSLRHEQDSVSKGIATSTSPGGDWNASDSFGSLLVQMQKSEEALLAVNKSHTLEDDAVNLKPTRKLSNDTLDGDASSKFIADNIERETELFEQKMTQLPRMDLETAKDLDDAVTRLTGTRDKLIEDLKILKLNPLYTSLMAVANTSKNATMYIDDADDTLTLSRPEHYLDRIDRDRRYLAVSIAASTEEVSQWRLFCQEQGGIFPILETVREGARAIRGGVRSKDSDQPMTTEAWSSILTGSVALDHREEESFHAACSACRAIRDLCAISPDQAAVVTDNILRANAAWDGGLMQDFTTILQYASAFTTAAAEAAMSAGGRGKGKRLRFRNRRDTRLRCQLYVSQLLLAMAVASDDAVHAIRTTKGLSDAVLSCSSYAITEQTRRWLRYPGEMAKWLWRKAKADDKKGAETFRRPYLEAAKLADDLKGQVQRSANQILAAIGYNKWVPKIPGQKGLRILCLDGGGSRGMAAITAVKCIMDKAGDGADVADSFDMIVGTSTGGIIAFLIGLQRESSAQAVERYKQLINKIFVKSALSKPLMLFTTATYDESHFMSILVNILKEDSMLDSRADPAVPLVCCLTSKMSSTPTRVALFRNYNYAGGELADPFTIDPSIARQELNLPLELEHEVIRNGQYQHKTSFGAGTKASGGSRHPGSFRVLQRYALRASTAAPTVFKPVMMGGEMYCDGGIVASNPAAVAIHEARAVFPDVPIELVVSVGTGAFLERKSAPRVGWDGIIGQIVNSATDGEQIHHVLEDILGQSAVLGCKHAATGNTRYFRFNPVIGAPDEFPIDVTDPDKIAELKKITMKYMDEPEQQAMMESIRDILRGRKGRRRRPQFFAKVRK